MTKRLLAIFFVCIIFLLCVVWKPVEAVLSKNQSKGVIIIDVGHGGSDPGKVSGDGTKEKDLNLEIAKYLRDYLIAQDFIVYLDRENDSDLASSGASSKKNSDLRNRVAFFSEKKGDCVISIHQNSFPEASSHGAQVFYYGKSDDGKEMANYIQNSLLKMDSTNKREAKANDSYYILTKSKMPVVIVECGFLSNPEETANLKDSSYQKQLAYSICVGFCKFWEANH